MRRRRLIALAVAAALHAGLGLLMYSSETLQFSHASAARQRSDAGVAVTLVSLPAPAAQPPAPVPPQAVPPRAEPPVQAPHATTRSDIQVPQARTQAAAPAAHPALLAPPTSPAVAASPQAPAEPTITPTPAPVAAAAPSAQSTVQTLPGAATATTEALACQVPQPPYPPRARRLRQAGTVVLRLNVLASGAVTGAQVAISSGFDSLDEAALDAVKQAHCKAGLPQGTDAMVAVAVPVHFSFLN